MALEVAVEGLRHRERERYLLDTFITAEVGPGRIIQSWIDMDTGDMYRVVLADSVAIDRVLTLSIPFRQKLRFDLLYRVTMRRMLRAHRPSDKQVELRHPNGCQRYSVCLQDAMALEKDLYMIITLYLTPAELISFGPLSVEYYWDAVPRQAPKPSAATPIFMWQLHNAIYEGNWALFEEAVNQCNMRLKETTLEEYNAKGSRPPDFLVTHLMQNLYRGRIAPHVNALKYDLGAPGHSKKGLAYGEINVDMARHVFLRLELNKASTF